MSYFSNTFSEIQKFTKKIDYRIERMYFSRITDIEGREVYRPYLDITVFS